MKLKEATVGALTNFEVLDFLRSREKAAKDPTRFSASLASSESKVYEYLVDSAARYQTREQINEFLERCKNYKLAKAEILNIINLRLSALVEIDPIIEKSEERFGQQLEELVNLVVEVFQEPHSQKDAEEGNNVDEAETTDRKNMDENEAEAIDGKNMDKDGRETANDEQIVEDQTEQTEGEQMEVG